MLEILMLINAERVKPLQIDPVLSEIATERAEYLCNKPFSHDGWITWFEDIEYKVAGENLAKGFKSVKKAHKAWMKSPSHKANVIKERYTKLGFGTADCGKKKDIYVELFTG